MTRAATMIRTAILALCPVALFGIAQAQDTQPPARFHHMHLNSTDPDAAIRFYSTRFTARRENFSSSMQGVWTGDSWLLFTRVDSPPPNELISGIWHIGWGAEDMPTAYRKQLDSGTRFATPLTDISEMVGGNRPFYYAYVDGPDHVLIEINTARHHRFAHVHLFSADPAATGAWYGKHFGWRHVAQPEKRQFRGAQIAPSAFITADHVSVIVYPIQYVQAAVPVAWRGRTEFASTRGRAIDHLGFAVDDLDTTLDRLRQRGVKVTAEPRMQADMQVRSGFIEGPDGVAIELLEDRNARPAPIAE